MRRGRVSVAVLMLALGAGAGSAVPAWGAISEPTQATRGLATRVNVEYPHTLRPKGDQTSRSPVRVRVEAGDAGASGGKPGMQTIVFIGNVAGDFDLRDALEREDGGSTSDLPPMPVHIVSRLPRDHAGEFFGEDERPTLTGGGYTAVLVALGVAWAMVPCVVLVRRAMRAKPPEPPAEAPAREPTLGERLALAIREAGGREMSPKDRAGLELLVIRYLSERSGRPMVPEADHARTLRALREDQRTGPVLVAIERWLHAGGTQAQRAEAGRGAIEAISGLGAARAEGGGVAALNAEAREVHA
ncbi:MAG: hypothetical protein GC200_06835 [Tepidisphaera sp.]|nr:hypothetical protein [Tepidisphaera sp.]